MTHRYRTPLIYLGTTLLLLALLFWRFRDWLAMRPDQVIEPYGDGYKAYHAILYHARYDPDFSWYQGMNYPYGEHVIPGASQPLLSGLLQLAQKAGWDWSACGFSLVHASMLLGFLIAGLALVAVFRKLGTDWPFAIGAGLALLFLSPQLERLQAHYGLAHPEVLPVVLLLLLRFEQGRGWLNSLLIAVVFWLFAQIHFYYFAILGASLGAYLLASWLLRGSRRSTMRYIVQGAIMIGLPLVYFVLFLHWTDPVEDRSAWPWGFFAFHSSPMGVFASVHEPHWQWVLERLRPGLYVEFEARSYVGLVAMVGLVILLIRWLAGRFRKDFWAPVPRGRRFLGAGLVAGTLLLLLSFGLPFVVPGLEDWLKYAGPYKQFRSVGRFAWLFFYTANIGLLTWLYYYTQREGVGYMILRWLAIAVLALEAFFFCRAIPAKLDTIPTLSPGQTYTETVPLNWGDYQAILPIPYYNIGSDQYWWDMSGLIGQHSQTLSWQTGLPMTAAMLTRTSGSQTRKQLQLVTEPYRPVALLKDLPDQRPLLMLWDEERAEREGRVDFSHLLSGATLEYSTELLKFYRLPLESFPRRLAAIQDSLAATLQRDSLLNAHQGYLTDSIRGPVWQDPFDQAADVGYYGPGYQQPICTHHVIMDTLLHFPAGEYELSGWLYIAADLLTRSQVKLALFDEAGQPLQSPTTATIRQWIKVFDPDGWGMWQAPLTLPDGPVRIRLTIDNDLLGCDQDLQVDELLLQPTGQNLYRELDDYLWWNNRFYRR